jgi:uncharacterized membrane protein HdeD (DUF308 family)
LQRRLIPNDSDHSDIERIQGVVAMSLREHWVLFLIEGIILLILGLAAIVIPPIATLALELLFG